MEEKEFIELTMQPSFLTKTLRRTGYDFETAVYELIDNAHKAQATNIKIIYNAFSKIFLEKGKIIYKGTFSFIDNGVGMTFNELLSFMQLSPYKVETNNDNASYFGVGGKTAIINIANIDGTSKAIITTIKNGEVTVIEWILSNDEKIIKPRIIKHYTDNNAVNGTTITITNVELDIKKIQPVVSNCGATYYPMLTSHPEINISLDFNLDGDYNGIYTIEKVVAEDPLYRNNDEVRKTLKEFEVDITYNNKIYKLKVENVYLFEDQFQNKNEYNRWDKKKSDTGITAKARCGLYINYGGRLIERGNNLTTIGLPDQFDIPGFRCIMTIDKELTELFQIKFNKTQGISPFGNNPILGCLVPRFKSIRNEYKRLYGGNSKRNTSKKIKIKEIPINEKNFLIKEEKFDNSLVPCTINYDKKQTIITYNKLTPLGKLLNATSISEELKSALRVFTAATASTANEFFNGDDDKVISFMSEFGKTINNTIKDGYTK